MPHNPAALVGLVLDNGPTNPADVLVLVAIAERCNADGMAWPSYDDIAARSRIARRNAIKRVAALVDAGWLGVRKGHGRGHSNLYVLNVARLKGDAGDTISPEIKGDAGDTIKREKVTLATIKGDAGVTRTPKNPQHIITRHAEQSALPLVVSVADVDDDEPTETTQSAQPAPVADELAVAGFEHENDAAGAAGSYERRLAVKAAFDGVLGKASRPLRMAVVAALDEGWQATDLNKQLHRAIDQQGGLARIGNVGGFVRTVLENLDAPPERVSLPTWCGTCDQRTRLLDFDGDHPRRCPSCNPLAATG